MLQRQRDNAPFLLTSPAAVVVPKAGSNESQLTAWALDYIIKRACALQGCLLEVGQVRLVLLPQDLPWLLPWALSPLLFLVSLLLSGWSDFPQPTALILSATVGNDLLDAFIVLLCACVHQCAATPQGGWVLPHRGWVRRQQSVIA